MTCRVCRDSGRVVYRPDSGTCDVIPSTEARWHEETFPCPECEQESRVPTEPPPAMTRARMLELFEEMKGVVAR